MDENLRRVAEVQQKAVETRDKLWQRVPVIWPILLAGIIAIFTLGVWSTKLQGRIETLEGYQWDLKHDSREGAVGIIEQAHANRDITKRNAAQIQQLNEKVFKVKDPGIDQ